MGQKASKLCTSPDGEASPRTPIKPVPVSLPTIDESPSRVSKDSIDEIVDDFMKDKAINNALLPDFIERSIYRNILHLIMGLLGRVLDTTEFSFLGHNITMKLTPEGSKTFPPV